MLMTDAATRSGSSRLLDLLAKRPTRDELQASLSEVEARISALAKKKGLDLRVHSDDFHALAMLHGRQARLHEQLYGGGEPLPLWRPWASGRHFELV